ncbi:MIP/aquaporin family protein [Gymnodinialimonas ulvae]|uniref:MIP/aquaporin family protein n=1 Tax=Gymnodinialimonas ulvae TaxID=3126504 RepID=UPI0030A61168
MDTLPRRLLAEALGTSFLLIAVVGSGIMAEALSGGNTGVALLANAIATGVALYVLITLFGPVSGAHFNPAVTLVFALRREISILHAFLYVICQVLAGIIGVWLAHVMFELPVLQASTTARTGSGQWVAEVIATFGLLFTILGGIRHAPAQVPALVAAYITGAYWFTASTSFANPAVTIARAFSDTFAGIAPGDVAPFIVAQIIGAVLALSVAGALYGRRA